MLALWVLGFWLPAMQVARGQERMELSSRPPAQSAPHLDRTLATLHGIVRNAATGEGIPRALIEIEGDADTGVLTDGDGHFEIPGVPVGPQAVQVRKPGWLDEFGETQAPSGDGRSGIPHNILVAAEMPDLVFTLARTCTIRGRVDLSSGDPAEGIEVGLMRRLVMDGRAGWQAGAFTKSRSDGTYRFGGLPDGQYALYTTPTLDSMPAVTLVAPGKGNAAERWGYASVYYPDARDSSGAAMITLANGEEMQANFTLTREPFETVIASVALPQSAAAGNAPGSYSAEVMDGAGHQLPYVTQYDPNSRTLQTALPDGSYSMQIASSPQPLPPGGSGPDGTEHISNLVGAADFSVAGHAVTNLRVPLSLPAPSPVQVNIIHSGNELEPIQNSQIAVMMSPAGGRMQTGMMMGQYAGGAVPGPLDGNYMAPGTYWVHTFISGRGLCEASFTAGGASLGREPVTIGLSGTTAPMQLALRDDCARLTLSLPENLTAIASGEDRFYSVYLVPDFDYTSDLHPVILRPSTSATVTLNDLTPGNYHVYVFKGDVQLEYRNPAALAALANPGQAITLSPGAASSLVLEAPEP
jgi:hypothetical protein